MSTKNSLAIYLAKKLKSKFKLSIFDKKIETFKYGKINLINEKENLKIKFDCIIFVNQNNNPSTLKKFTNPKTIIIDPYGFFKDYYKKNLNKYFSIGNKL